MALSAPETLETHLVLFPHTGYGHNRALCNLVARLVQAQRMHITYFTAISICERVQNEIRRNFEASQADLVSLIRVVAISNDGFNGSAKTHAKAALADVYKTLVNEQPLTCCHTGVQYPALPSPNVAIVDLAVDGPSKIVRKFSKKPVKVLGWAACAASCLVTLMSPQLNIPPRGVREEALRSGRDPSEVAQEMMDNLGGAELQIPGFPLLYDHELQPQQTVKPMVGIIGSVVTQVSENVAGCDGILILSVECLEKTFLDSLRTITSETLRTVHACGPLVPVSEHAAAYEMQSTHSTAISEFMDRVLETHGARSLVHISFGSWLWPVRPEFVWAFLDILIELHIPFILSHASRAAVIPDAVAEKVKNSKLGLLSSWAPQQAILAHPATGWMVTHAGQNGFIEAMTYGIPIICWPYTYDQPYIALHATVNLDVAYELFEVRTGVGRGAVHRLGRAPEGTVDAVRREVREVLRLAFGEDGQRKRANALRLKEEMARAWDADGSATRELGALLAVVTGPYGTATGTNC